ncbi:MAG: hypothetical protein WAV23_01770 [Minisyncoccia bacterium]
MNFIKKNIHKLSLFAFILLVPVFTVFAQGTVQICDPAGGKICPPISVTSLNDFIKILLQGAIKIGIPIIALAIIYSGFLFVKARGNPGEIEVAKKSLLYTVIGAAILLGAWAIAQIITNTILAL